MTTLNLATIVHRLCHTPQGWPVDDLCRELEIAPRTYRKYRKLLQDQFLPFSQGGLSLLAEDPGPRGRALRLARPCPATADLLRLLGRVVPPGATAPNTARDLQAAFVREWTRTASRAAEAGGHVVELLFANDRWLQRYVREGCWFSEQSFEPVAGGRLRMTLRVGSLSRVAAWLAQFGDDVEVLRPAELRALGD